MDNGRFKKRIKPNNIRYWIRDDAKIRMIKKTRYEDMIVGAIISELIS